ncbi:MAG: hypothetical protein VX798_17055 [Bacteroidota bacterium]|jgi:hypothetical protein|uniref:Uncharacterized protein n=1 Tax=Flagellimonas iocasae TaxID=2055905 RepID=A0ABW4XW89_9FLAO|nr:hypothetical protein [Allomuricauda oceanensis]MEC7772892.1 hypothetical protein [Bacteroidota bacterium]
MRFLFCLVSFIISIQGFAQNPVIEPYVNFLNHIDKTSAKDYILQKFDDHDIVILCERDHSEFTQYELVKEILSDERFQKNIKNLFTEIGLINLQPEITQFLKTKGLDSVIVDKRLSQFQRDASFWVIWDRYNYHFLLKTIYDINNLSDNQIHYYPSDVEFDWQKVNNVEDYDKEQEFELEPRDSLIARNIINTYKRISSKGNNKALIILNYRHAFKINMVTSNGETVKNAGKYLQDYFGERLASILTNRPIFTSNGNGFVYGLIQDGKWDASFKSENIRNMGFDLHETVFGNDGFDMWKGNTDNLKYEDVFDGFVFYEPLENHRLLDYYKGLVPKEHEKEFFRRYRIQMEYIDNDEVLKKLDNNDFRESLLKEVNTPKERKYPNFDQLMEIRDENLRD